MCRGIFGKIIVSVCVLEMIAVQMWAMYIAGKTGEQMIALVGANHSVFGGELLLLCLKRIMAKPIDDEHDDKENK